MFYRLIAERAKRLGNETPQRASANGQVCGTQVHTYIHTRACRQSHIQQFIGTGIQYSMFLVNLIYDKQYDWIEGLNYDLFQTRLNGSDFNHFLNKLCVNI